MRIRHIQAIPVQLPRDFSNVQGTAGSPHQLKGGGRYRWSIDYPALYSTELETALVRVTTSDGLVGWGEAQAPLAPQVACSIIEHLLAPMLTGEEFHGSVEEIQQWWWRMYSTMRVRGQTGGFMLDAIAGIDLALWDLAGKMARKPVCELIAPGSSARRVPAYLSGVSGACEDQRCDYAQKYFDQGFTAVKLYYESDWHALLSLAGRLRARADVAVDALWHLPPAKAVEYGRELDQLRPLWLECPLMPEEIDAHEELSRSIETPVAVGESYRTCWELRPFLQRRIARYIQPDLGRCGITESRNIARLADQHDARVVPHLSIAFPPQAAAAIHFAAATNCILAEYNPRVLEAVNRFTSAPLEVVEGAWLVPQGAGLGIDIRI